MKIRPSKTLLLLFSRKMLNVTAIGNLARDPELKNISNIPAAIFSIGVATGKDQTTWTNCTVFGEKKAETVMQYLKKGHRVAVSGKGSLRKYEGQDGSEKSSFDLLVNDFTFLQPKSTEPQTDEF